MDHESSVQPLTKQGFCGVTFTCKHTTMRMLPQGVALDPLVTVLHRAEHHHALPDVPQWRRCPNAVDQQQHCTQRLLAMQSACHPGTHQLHTPPCTPGIMLARHPPIAAPHSCPQTPAVQQPCKSHYKVLPSNVVLSDPFLTRHHRNII